MVAISKHRLHLRRVTLLHRRTAQLFECSTLFRPPLPTHVVAMWCALLFLFQRPFPAAQSSAKEITT
jgi:hypothetical protein